MRQFIYHACNGTLGYHSLRHASIIDLIHNDVKQCFRGSNVHCGIFSHERIQFGVVFPQSGKFKMVVRLTCVLMWLGCRVAARAICLSFQMGLDPVLLLFLPLLALMAAILALSVTTTP